MKPRYTGFEATLRSVKAFNIRAERKARRAPVTPYIERTEPFSDEQFPKLEMRSNYYRKMDELGLKDSDFY